jgi:hypothetical protein
MSAILVSKYVLDQRDLALIGSIALECTYCEQAVEQIIWCLCKLKPEQGKFFTDRILLDKRLELLGDLWKPLLKGQALVRLTDLIGRIKEMNSKRNTIIHGEWTRGGKVIHLGVMGLMALQPAADVSRSPPPKATRRRAKSDPVSFDATELSKVAEAFAELTAGLVEFAASHGVYPKPWELPSADRRRKEPTEPSKKTITPTRRVRH